MTVEEKLASISNGSIVILEFPAEASQIKLAAELLKLKEKSNSCGIYVSSNRPSSNLIEKITAHGYDLKKALEDEHVVIVDLVSKNVSDSEVEGVIYVSSASELSATQMAIEKAVKRIKDKDGWILLDSIATLLVFNSPDSLLEFLHFLIGRLRVLGMDGAIFTVREGIDAKVIATTRQFCDAIVEL